jgi:hypothetical protein
MAAIPKNQVTGADIQEWYRLKKELGILKSKEALLRQKVFDGLFPNPVEGTNTFPLEPVDGINYALKAVYPINRKIDAALLSVHLPLLRETLPVDKLIKYPPDLVLAEYRTLTAEEQKLFDSVMEIKPGMPGLEISAVKR